MKSQKFASSPSPLLTQQCLYVCAYVCVYWHVRIAYSTGCAYSHVILCVGLLAVERSASSTNNYTSFEYQHQNKKQANKQKQLILQVAIPGRRGGHVPSEIFPGGIVPS